MTNEDSLTVEQSEQDEVQPTRPRIRPDRADTSLTVVLWVVVVAILVAGSFFAYTVWAAEKAEDLSSPAMRALEELRQMVTNYPDNDVLRVRYGETLATAGLISEAVEQFEVAIEINPEHGGAYLNLALLAMSQEEFSEAEPYLLKVLELTDVGGVQEANPRREQALFYLGEIALRQERYEDAISFYQSALRIRRDASDSYLGLGLAYRGIDEHEKSLEYFEAALAFDPAFGRVHFEMGRTYLALDDDVNAAVHLRLATELAPGVPEPVEALETLGTASEWLGSARTAFESDDHDVAVHDILMARALAPDGLDAALLHGQILLAIDETDFAIQTYREALEIDPENQEAIQALTDLGVDPTPEESDQEGDPE